MTFHASLMLLIKLYKNRVDIFFLFFDIYTNQILLLVLQIVAYHNRRLVVHMHHLA